MKDKQVVDLPKLRAEVSVQPSTFNEQQRTVDVRFYSGSFVQRYPLFGEPYELGFSLKPEAVRLDRFNGGAPVLDNHNDFGSVSETILGVVEKAWLAKDGGRARIRFSSQPKAAGVLADIRDGILRNFSMGAVIHAADDITEKGAKRKKLIATDWEPLELSVVGVPADPNAQALAAEERFPCRISTRGAEAAPGLETVMTKDIETAADDAVDLDTQERNETESADSKSDARLLEDAKERDTAHSALIRNAAEHYQTDELFTQRHVKLGTPIKQFIKLAVEERAKHAPKTEGDLGFGEDRNSVTWKRERMEDALLARMSGEAPPGASEQFMYHGFVECAYELLQARGMARGLHPKANKSEIIRLSLHSTSDYPLLLENALNKTLLPAYEAAAPTYRLLSARRTFNDFRVHKFSRPGDFPAPVLVGENAEYTYGTMGENREQVSLFTYGRILGLSRQILINDDLGAFQDFGARIAQRLADFENAHFFTTLITSGSGLGPVLSDTLTVYHATHNNVTGAGALDNTRLGEARKLMMKQTSLDGIKLNVSGSVLLVSPDSLTLAETLLASIVPVQASNVNIFAGRLVAVGDANLTGTRFYVLADPGRLPQYIYGFLGDNEGPRVTVREGFNTDNVETKVSLDFAVGAIEFRAGVSGAGA